MIAKLRLVLAIACIPLWLSAAPDDRIGMASSVYRLSVISAVELPGVSGDSGRAVQYFFQQGALKDSDLLDPALPFCQLSLVLDSASFREMLAVRRSPDVRVEPESMKLDINRIQGVGEAGLAPRVTYVQFLINPRPEDFLAHGVHAARVDGKEADNRVKVLSCEGYDLRESDLPRALGTSFAEIVPIPRS